MGNKKESIKPNEVAAPTLFVGVGGTGCKIVKKVADLCAPEEKENIKYIEKNLSKYLYCFPEKNPEYINIVDNSMF